MAIRWKMSESVLKAALGKQGAAYEMGMALVSASVEEVVLEWEVSTKHFQPAGIVNGGVYCLAVETVCSIGASLALQEREPNAQVVGMENQTSFLRPVRRGKLWATSRPVSVGRTTQLWEASITDEQGRLIASGRVRLMNLRPMAGGESGDPALQG